MDFKKDGLFVGGILNPEQTEDFRCNLDWTSNSPKLIFTFSPEIHPENIMELSNVIEKTVTKWFGCKSCGTSEICDKKYN